MKAVGLLAILVSVVLGSASVRADGGDAGLVIDWGDGTVTTACVGFEGDSISGDELLSRAGHSVNDFSGMVCGIDGVGHEHSGTFASCLADCPSGGPDCIYWAFFTMAAGEGEWRYSARGYRVEHAGHGELHGWRWGQGASGRADPPPDISFVEVCEGPAIEEPAATAAVIPTPVEQATPETAHEDDDVGMSNGSLIAFGAVAAVLVAAIVGGLVWRARNGR